ncbi:cupredoxin domain-containing protein [Methanohalophilus mahii]|uniref:Blue (Type 1) copper domain protein n=1 Tax=Methanohalophilus mahii (strain ATCC 35705 / DSM 5219 / SLP) TaxID=547558 RepID=D5EB89_METMS|nr:cupredoxin family copper-binding protein [Methanohalophilus mahii]ADE36440.1 blue (type 1) copper domain protein [Methanohalophilus mahii DSM 5219]
MKKVSMILVVLIAVFLAIGCAGYQQSGNEAEESGEAVETTNVIMEDIQFKPATIQVSVGDTVTWTNEDSATHTVTGQDFDSGNLGQGEIFTYTFDEAGTYDYECTIHPSMTGTVIVGENTTDSGTEDDENTGGY